jgi:hypothetical protein
MKRYRWLLILVVLSVACSDAGTTGPDLAMPTGRYSMLSLVAGGLGGAGMADGTGAAARFGFSYGVAVDGAGNLFVADTMNNTIRKVVVATGAVTTLAGTAGMFGSTDGTGAAARFFDPSGVAVDGAGNLFVADRLNHTIRKVVVATGAVTTLAGTTGMSGSTDAIGTAARFNRPYGVALDSSGNLFVADSSNHTIRKVVVATGAVTTLAGTTGMSGSTDATGTAARFNRPYGLALDGTGNLFVADFSNHTIRKVVVATGAVTTLAGTASMSGSTDGMGAAVRFKGPSAVALDGAGNLFVTDSNNHTIRKVAVATGAVTTLAGTAGMSGSTDGTGAVVRFNVPTAAAVDSAGNLLVADYNCTLRKVVVATGAVTTLAGTASMTGSTDGTGAEARFNSPSTVAVDGVGNLFVADSLNHTIRKVVLATGAVTTLVGTAGMSGGTDGTGAAARFNLPTGVAVDGTGNLFVADSGNHTIRKVVVATSSVITLAGTVGMSGSTDGTGAAARFSSTQGVAVDGAGNLFVADSGNHTIRKIVVATGAVTTLAGTAGMSGSTDGTGAAALFNFPYGVAVDGEGSLFVAEAVNHTIRKVVLATGAVTTLAGTARMSGSTDGTGATARFNFPYGVAVDGAGNLFVADFGNHAIRKIQLSNASVTTLVGVADQFGVTPGPLPARLSQPRAVAALTSGALFILDENSVLSVL